MGMDYEKRTKETYEAFNAHDVHKYLAHHSEDISLECIADGSTVHGKKGLHLYINTYFTGFSNIRMDMISCISGGNRQCEEWRMTGTHDGNFHGLPPSGKTISLRGIFVREWRNGRTCRLSSYYDQASFMRQLGGSVESYTAAESAGEMPSFHYPLLKQDYIEWPDSM